MVFTSEQERDLAAQHHQADSRKRLTVTEMTPGGLYRVTVRPGGVIVLEPVVAVPLSEARSRGMRP